LRKISDWFQLIYARFMTAEFADMHKQGTFLMVNVHDAGSAAIAESAGAVALGTTSSGHAYTLARRDAEGALSRTESVQRVAEICAAVDLPVSVDAENGWGHEPSDVADTINMLADAGAAGASIEDWSGDLAIGFYDRPLALARIEAAVETARSRPAPFVICARAEAFLHGTPEPMDEAIARLRTFAEAGANCLYAPGPRDPADLRKIVEEAGGPVNALIGVGSTLTMADAAELGIRRVSVGGSLYLATMATFKNLVTRMVTTGSFEADPRPIRGGDLESLFP
jgi:2-methylisocitrate lyase-like PEP mutase family enzyme